MNDADSCLMPDRFAKICATIITLRRTNTRNSRGYSYSSGYLMKWLVEPRERLGGFLLVQTLIEPVVWEMMPKF